MLVNEIGINNYYLDDMVDVEVSQFVRQGVHFNETIDFKDIENAKNNEKKYNHIDMVKAYSNFKMCKYYKGFVGKITDYRKTNKIVDVGYYRIENIRFKNANVRLKQYNEVMKIYNENVYPSPELEFLMANGVEFDIIEGCWGSSFKFEFDEHMLNTKDNDIKYYCKYVGNMFYYSEYNSFFMNCNEKLADHITYSSEYDMVSFNQEEQEVKVSYKKQHNNHLSHVCGFITSYMRMNVMEQLLSIEFNDVIRVCVDGIYLYGDYKTLNCFRDKPELIKQNEASESYISNDVCEIPKCKNGIRSHHLKELHKGVGGSGKTHLNIYDDGLIRKLFVAPSWKLSRSKNIAGVEETNNNPLSMNDDGMDARSLLDADGAGGGVGVGMCHSVCLRGFESNFRVSMTLMRSCFKTSDMGGNLALHSRFIESTPRVVIWTFLLTKRTWSC